MKYYFEGEWYTDRENRVRNPQLAKKYSTKNLELQRKKNQLEKQVELIEKQQAVYDSRFRELVNWPEPRVLEDWEKVAY